MTRRTRRERTGTRRTRALQRAQERALRREGRPSGGWLRRLRGRAERARPWLQIVTGLATLLARPVR